MRNVIALSSILLVGSIASAGEAIKIVALGDSITRGVRGGVKAEDTFAHQLQKALKVEVVNVGIGGERTDQALKRLDAVLKLKPTIVTIMYGTNDSYIDKGAKDSRLSPEEYRANLHKLVSELRKVGVKPILMSEPRWGDKASANGIGEHPNVRLERFVQVCREVAAETKTPFVDHFAHWTKQNAGGIDIGGWTTDQCHPNPRGHAEITKLMLPVLQRVLPTKVK